MEDRTRRLRGVILARTGALDQARDVLRRAAPDAEPSTAIACYAEAVITCFYVGERRVGWRWPNGSSFCWRPPTGMPGRWVGWRRGWPGS